MKNIQPLTNYLTVETSSDIDPTLVSVLEKAFGFIQEKLRTFASGVEFSQQIELAFGTEVETQAVLSLAQAWQKGDFRIIPSVEILSAEQLKGANGAFAATTNNIYFR